MCIRDSYQTALKYTINHKEALRNSLLDVRLEVSNNRSERAIRPFVMGRKNWLFCNTARGAQSSAILYSIVISAKDVYKRQPPTSPSYPMAMPIPMNMGSRP